MDSNLVSGKKISIIEGIFAQFHITLTGGMFLTSFALFLNANPFQIGILTAIPSILAGVGFFAAYFANIIGKRKTPCLITAIAGRSLFIFFVIGLIFDIRISIDFFFVIVFLFNLLLNFSGNLWLSWMSDLIPKEERGRYFGIRTTIISAVGMAVNYLGGMVLDHFETDKAFIIIFSTAVFFSTLAGITLSAQPEPKFEKKSINFRDVFVRPLKDNNFVALIKFVSFWYFFAGVSAPFWVVHMIRNLKMAYSSIAVYGIIAGIASLFFQILWGKLIDRVRSKPILTINFAGTIFLPIIWLFARPDFILPIWIDAFFSGLFWCGINLSLFNILLSLTEEKELKESYFAVFSTITGICGFLSSLLGGFIAQILEDFKFEFLGQRFVNFHILFLWTSFFRFLSVFLLKKVQEKEAYPTFQTLQLIGDYAVRRLNENKDLLLNILRFTR
ncbi:MAG: MFS transporter [candidate division WOR-3 bacterium]|nr:MFS transporter [candidate division WOR-3 bacterium]